MTDFGSGTDLGPWGDLYDTINSGNADAEDKSIEIVKTANFDLNMLDEEGNI